MLVSSIIRADSELTKPKFSTVLTDNDSYSNVASGVAWEVLQAVFFAPRGSPASIIRKEIAPKNRAKIDAIHEMFKLAELTSARPGPH